MVLFSIPFNKVPWPLLIWEMKKLLLKDHGQMSSLMDPLANIRCPFCPLEYSFNHSVLSSSVNDVDDDLILQYYTVN